MIVAAAIRNWDGRVHALPAPARHGHVIHWIVENTDVERVPGDWKQGFIDSDRGFVNREDAWAIAKAANQLLPRAPTDGRGGELYSEDVW
jgi:hypothetical protein